MVFETSLLWLNAGFLWPFIVVIAVWDLVWKLFGMWKAAHKNSVVWFVVLAIFNTAGILPILYIYVFSEMKKKGKRRR